MTGTGTEIGKTWWTAAVARALVDDAVHIAIRKPVQSCAPGATTDAEALAAASGEAPDVVTPPHRTYRVAWAPPMAADALGLPPFTVAELVDELRWPEGVDVGLVESVGGPRSPLAADGDTVTLIDALAPDLTILVADAGIGTINAVRLSAAVLTRAPLIVALNRYCGDPLHARNRTALAGDGLEVVTTPADLARRIVGTRA